MDEAISECPDANLLRLSASGELDPDQHVSVQLHIATCTTCRGVLDTAASDVSSIVREADSNSQSAAAPYSLPNPGDIIDQRYRIERYLGRGAMGVVFTATHLGLERIVALKVLRVRGADASARFMREARALARLDSEHIVRVHDTGRLADGTPYLAMEHLSGLDLSKVIAQQPPSLDTALDYVRQACAALEVAHAAGIVHRDLKPSNLFLTDVQGVATIKVLDFGIAKYVLPAKALPSSQGQTVDTGELTSTGIVLGSPHFMSPEQVYGQESVDARSDIWAVGVMLYQLLTQRLPFACSSAGATMVAVATQAPAPPSQLRPEIPSALNDLVLRCLQKDPDRRFQSVQQLSAALAALTPQAPEAKPARARRRSVLFGSIAVGLIVTASWIALQAPTDAPTMTRDSVDQISTELVAHFPDLGSPQRARVLTALQEMGDVAQVALSERAIQEAKNGNLRIAEGIWLQAYEDAEKQQKVVRKEQARAARNMAALAATRHAAESLAWYRKATSLDPQDFDGWMGLGDAAISASTVLEAEEAFRTASQLANEAEDTHARAQAQSRLGNVLKTQGKLGAARQAFASAVSNLARPSDNSGSALLQDLGTNYLDLANLLRTEGNLVEALQAFDAATAIRRQLVAAMPADLDRQRDLTAAYHAHASAFKAAGDLPHARALHESALALSQQLSAAHPDNPLLRADVSLAYARIGDTLMAEGKLPEAQASLEKVVQLNVRLRDGDPTNVKYQRSLSVSYNKLGSVLRAQGRLSDARAAYTSGLELAEKLAHADPNNRDRQHDLSVSYELLGTTLKAAGQLSQAQLSYEHSWTIAKQLSELDADNADLRRDLSVMHNKLGDVLLAQGKSVAGREQYQAAYEIRRQLLERDPVNSERQRDLQFSEQALASAWLAEGKLTQAHDAAERGLAIAKQRAASRPNDPDAQDAIATCYRKLGDVALAAKQVKDAHAAYAAALDAAKRVADQAPRDANYQSELAANYGKLGDVLLVEADARAALAAYKAALAISTQLALESASNMQRQHELAVNHTRLGNALSLLSDPAGAKQAWGAAAVIDARLAAAGIDNAQWPNEASVRAHKAP